MKTVCIYIRRQSDGKGWHIHYHLFFILRKRQAYGTYNFQYFVLKCAMLMQPANQITLLLHPKYTERYYDKIQRVVQTQTSATRIKALPKRQLLPFGIFKKILRGFAELKIRTRREITDGNGRKTAYNNLMQYIQYSGTLGESQRQLPQARCLVPNL